MESRTPVTIMTGVRMGDSIEAEWVPQVNNTTGVLHGHHIQSTMTDLQIPVYSSAPKRTRTAVWALRGPRPGPLDDGGLGAGDFIRRSLNRQSKRHAVHPGHARRWSGSFRCQRCATGR